MRAASVAAVVVVDMYWFLCLPTLVYQLSYPRLNRPIHWPYIARRLGELLFLSGLVLLIIEQYTLPLLSNALSPLEANDTPKILERWLKLVCTHCAA
jgi:diacylglycerol O-acyltransferase 1